MHSQQNANPEYHRQILPARILWTIWSSVVVTKDSAAKPEGRGDNNTALSLTLTPWPPLHHPARPGAWLLQYSPLNQSPSRAGMDRSHRALLRLPPAAGFVLFLIKRAVKALEWHEQFYLVLTTVLRIHIPFATTSLSPAILWPSFHSSKNCFSCLRKQT